MCAAGLALVAMIPNLALAQSNLSSSPWVLLAKAPAIAEGHSCALKEDLVAREKPGEGKKLQFKSGVVLQVEKLSGKSARVKSGQSFGWVTTEDLAKVCSVEAKKGPSIEELEQQALAAATAEAGLSSAGLTSQNDAKAKSAAPVSASAPDAVEAKGLDARVRRLSDKIAYSLKRLAGDHREQVFAVLRFGVADDAKSDQDLGLVVSELIITNLVRDHRLNLVERAKLKEILTEQAMAQAGILDEKNALKVGQMLGATALILGEVSAAGDAFSITARVADGQSGQVLSAESATLPKSELVALAKDSVVLRSKSGAFFRSMVAPGWGQIYNHEPTIATLVAGSVGMLFIATVTTLSMAIGAQIEYNALQPSTGEELSAESALYDTVIETRVTSNNLYTAAAVLGSMTAVIWAGGAVEAYVSGVDVESLDQATANY